MHGSGPMIGEEKTSLPGETCHKEVDVHYEGISGDESSSEDTPIVRRHRRGKFTSSLASMEIYQPTTIF